MTSHQKESNTNIAYKKLGINISLFAISAFGSKILQFLLVPLYTNCLSTAEYGTVDLLSTVVQLLVPVFTLDIADAVLRFSLDDFENKSSVFAIALQIIMYGAAVLLAILVGVKLFFGIKYPVSYYYFIFFNFLFSAIYSSISYYLRGLEKVKAVVVAGVMSTLVNVIFNILFLLILGWGMNGYLSANIIGIIVPTIYLMIVAYHEKCVVLFNNKNEQVIKIQMLKYSLPLIVNGISWWINNSLDRFVVTAFLGVESNGLLAVAYKIPSILAMFTTIFSQAWTMSAVQEFDSEDKNHFLSRTYSLYNCGMTIVCSCILLLNIPFAYILYAKDFFVAWQYTGFLIVAYLFGALVTCVSGIFSAVKDSKTIAISTMIGACTNFLLNITLIGYIGIQGATFATLISNIIVWIYRMYKVRTYVKLRIRIKRDIASYVIVLVQCVIGLQANHCYFGQMLCLAIIILLYKNDIITVINVLKNKSSILRRK